MKLPRLLKSDGTIDRIVNPIKVSLTQTLVPLSTATITLPKGENLPARGYVELFNPYGSAGVFRVRSPRDAYGDEITTAELEHAISEVGDYLVKAEYSEMMSASTAMTRIFSHYNGSKWKLGSVSALGSGQVAVEARYVRVLDAMLAILNQKRDCMMSFDFSTKPWTVSIVKKGTVVSAEGRLERNVSSATVSYDDTELCTRVYYQTYSKNKSGDIVATWRYKDADTKSKYGIIEHDVATSSDMTDAEINAVVDTYLNEHKNPRVPIVIDGEELSAITGESMDKFTIGKLFRLVVPEYNVVVEDNITETAWADVYGDPTNVEVSLGDEEDSVVTFIHNLDTKGSGGGGGGGGAKKEEKDKWKEYETHFGKTDYLIDMYARRVDRAGNILEQAGLDINSQGVLIYAETANGISSKLRVLNDRLVSTIRDTKNDLSSQILQLKDQIKLKVSKGSLVSEINIDPSGVQIKANKIDIQGIVTSLASYNLLAIKVTAGVGDFTLCSIGGETATWKDTQVVTGITYSNSSSKNFLYGTTSSPSGTYSGHVVNTYSTTTLHYLG